ncbi:MAG: class I SAM-dependent methyltransferase [Eubacteriales bacterium]|nr:class I SAM-dependent methyltransferase [Eubacteriales bacterium]
MKEILAYAKTHKVPIIQKEGLDFLLAFIKEHNIKTVLEIGTAIGYSAIHMAQAGCEVVTIEREFDAYCTAYDNVHRFGLQNKIQLIYADAMLYQTERQFDLLFIDGAKAQSILFLKQYYQCLKPGSYVLVDNINFHNCTYGDEVLTRNVREMVTKIKRYVDYIQAQTEFKSTLYPVGDGICVSEFLGSEK